MWNRSKKWLIPGILTVICAAAIACGTNTVNGDAPVMEINGETVVKEEYQMILKDYVAQVKMQYTTDEANQKDFWNAEFSDGSPIEKIMDLAEEELTEKKVVVHFAKEAGIDAPLDYNSMQEQMQRHNNESIYGLTSFELEGYYDYVYMGIESDVIEYLKKENELTEEELRRIYEEKKADYTSDVSVDMLVVEMMGETDTLILQEMAGRMAQETDLQILGKSYPDAYFYNITLSTLDTQESKSGVYMYRWQVASEMQEGEVCEPFFVGNSVMIMRCLNREENVVHPFEEVKGVLESEVVTAKAKEVIRQKVQEAKVVVIENINLEQIALEALEK